MTRLALLWSLLLGTGTTLVLSALPWARRLSLSRRLAPYAPGGTARATAPKASASAGIGPWRDSVVVLVTAAGARVARACGVEAAVLATLAQLPTAVATATVLLAPLAGFLVVEQRLATRSRRWQERLQVELPVVAEQLGMLLSSGRSLGAALSRVAGRGTGCCARDLTRVVRRIRQGLTESDALAEWAALAGVDGVHHLVAVLSLHRQASDLGALVSAEARSMRRDAHRRLLEQLERRAQAVWIPVTIATLVPGVIFLAVPFVAVLHTFSGS